MAVCALISLLLGLAYSRLAALAGQGFGAELRKAEFRKVQSFSFKNLDHFSTSSLVTRLTNDITVLQNAVSNGIRPLVRSPVMLVTALSLSAVMSPRLALVFVAALPVLAAACSLSCVGCVPCTAACRRLWTRSTPWCRKTSSLSEW